MTGKRGAVEGHKAYPTGLNENKGKTIKAITELLAIKEILVSEGFSQIHMMDVPAIEIAKCLEYGDGDDALDETYIIELLPG